jgi:hypothetical protein
VKSYKTLKGFVTDAEPDGLSPTFAHSATLRISSEESLDFKELGETLGVTPTRTVRRGEQVGPRSPPAKGDVWTYQAPVEKERDLGEHIAALWHVLKPHQSFLRALKARAHVDVFLGYSSNIDHAGLRVSYRELELFTALELDFALNVVVLSD